MAGSRSIARAVAACVMLILAAGCSSDPVLPSPTPLPTNTPEPPLTATPASTPFPTVDLTQLRPDPLISVRAPDLTSTLGTAVDGVYCSPAWRDSVFPASISIPVGPVRGDLLLEWNSGSNSDYISPPNANTYGIPASYTISTSTDSTNGTNGTWTQVVSVTGNRARTREHRFPFAGDRWVRMTVTSAVPGPLGNMFAIDEIELHDASNGTDDSVFFLGDSITVESFTRCPATQPSFAELVHEDAPQHFPAMIDGGVGAVNSGYGVSVIQDWLRMSPDFHIWAIGYGTNDAWQKVHPDVFAANLQAMVNSIRAAGRVPIIAHIPFAIKGPDDADVRALNGVIDQVTVRNGLLPGPDLYAWFSTHPNELSSDGVHPTDAGAQSINRLWYEALRPLYGISP